MCSHQKHHLICKRLLMFRMIALLLALLSLSGFTVFILTIYVYTLNSRVLAQIHSVRFDPNDSSLWIEPYVYFWIVRDSQSTIIRECVTASTAFHEYIIHATSVLCVYPLSMHVVYFNFQRYVFKVRSGLCIVPTHSLPTRTQTRNVHVHT